MSVANPFAWYLSHHGNVIIDGALATELQQRGCDLNDPLWSAKVLIEQPQLITAVHYDYFVAGADCVITASYQASPLGFAKRGLSKEQSIALIKSSVELAKQAKTKYQQLTHNNRPLVIAGSVGPYGAYLADGSEYTGNYHLSNREMADFHYDRIKALIDAGVDILACETMPSFAEIKVVADIITQFPSTPCWFSFTLKDSHHLSDGTPLEQVINFLESNQQIVAVGINCIALEDVTDALAKLNQLTNKLLIAYPNSGEHYDPISKTWKVANQKNTLCHQFSDWQKNGAKLIGGCCRTTPKDIEQLSKKRTETTL